MLPPCRCVPDKRDKLDHAGNEQLISLLQYQRRYLKTAMADNKTREDYRIPKICFFTSPQRLCHVSGESERVAHTFTCTPCEASGSNRHSIMIGGLEMLECTHDLRCTTTNCTSPKTNHSQHLIAHSRYPRAVRLFSPLYHGEMTIADHCAEGDTHCHYSNLQSPPKLRAQLPHRLELTINIPSPDPRPAYHNLTRTAPSRLPTPATSLDTHPAGASDIEPTT